MEYFIQGFTVGLAYVAPIGLQNLFVINSALTHNKGRALLTALIVIFFDVSLALACFFGIGALIQDRTWLQMIILLVGSLIVIYIGIGLLRSKPAEIEKEKSEMSIGKTISKACVVTWFNPQALIDGSLMLGAFYVTLPATKAMTFISGVSLASFSWFIGLTFLITLFSSKFDAKLLRVINIICGLVIILYGGNLLLNFIKML